MSHSRSKKNILFLVLDTHRRDRLGLYGYDRGTSPNLDAFSRDATVFVNAISPAQWTIPAHASMFSGEFPSTHLTTQSRQALDPHFRTLAEWLGRANYRRVGFCNNPLVGVIDNGLKRGFEAFYNYGGAIPSVPARSGRRRLARPFRLLWEQYTQLLRRISYPIQNAIARSDMLFKLSLNPYLVPLWTRFANFKGDTASSLSDATEYLKHKMKPGADHPHFMFVNLMETHLPYGPPEPLVSSFAPYFKEERAARDFMRVYNTRALHWLLPMDEPFSVLQARTLSDLYDAEVAYQDRLLAELLETLQEPYHRENTLVVIVADHGELLGEHQLMGHGFSVYQELVHVPLVVRFPGQEQGMSVQEPVSTVQVFHTALDGAVEPEPTALEEAEEFAARVDWLSLRKYLGGGQGQFRPVFSEAFPPENLIRAVEDHRPELVERFKIRSPLWAAYNRQGHKLVRVKGDGDVLFDLKADPAEGQPRQADASEAHALYLQNALDQFLEQSVARRPEHMLRRRVKVDEALLRRLRRLGYLE